MVKRYDCDVCYDVGMTAHVSGDWVSYSDYATLLKERDALAAENAALKKAAEFSTAPDMWIEQADGMLDYRYCEWYVDVLKDAMETPATDAFLAEMRAQGLEMFAERKNNEMMSLHPDTHAVGSIAAAMSAEVKELREFATQLRKGGAA